MPEQELRIRQEFRVVYTSTWSLAYMPEHPELNGPTASTADHAYELWLDYMQGHTSGYIRTESRTITETPWS